MLTVLKSEFKPLEIICFLLLSVSLQHSEVESWAGGALCWREGHVQSLFISRSKNRPGFRNALHISARPCRTTSCTDYSSTGTEVEESRCFNRGGPEESSSWSPLSGPRGTTFHFQTPEIQMQRGDKPVCLFPFHSFSQHSYNSNLRPHTLLHIFSTNICSRGEKYVQKLRQNEKTQTLSHQSLWGHYKPSTDASCESQSVSYRGVYSRGQQTIRQNFKSRPVGIFTPLLL